jgi:hypothetical protein
MTSTTATTSSNGGGTTPAGPAGALEAVSDRALVQARACPRCEAPAMPAAGMQVCVHCKKPFLLVAGPRLDASRVPKTTDHKAVKVTYSDGVMRYSATVENAGISVSELDPVTGRISMNKRTVAWADIATVGLYRRVDWVFLVALVVLFGVPIVIPSLIGSFSLPWLFLFSLPCAALFALGLKKSIGVGVQRMRVTPVSGPPMLFRFDSPMRKRKKFLAGVVERCGFDDVGWKA